MPRNSAIVSTIEKEFWLRSTGKRMKLEPHQRRILNEMFRVDPKTKKLKYTTMVYSCPKKSGKTEIAAAVTYAFARIYGGEMYSIANDEEGAKNRMYDRMVQALSMMRDEDPE